MQLQQQKGDVQKENWAATLFNRRCRCVLVVLSVLFVVLSNLFLDLKSAANLNVSRTVKHDIMGSSCMT
tara:strand:- start:69 stop:275 length:207 start_codon:yes stop_codon:yes gene_type:complete